MNDAAVLPGPDGTSFDDLLQQADPARQSLPREGADAARRLFVQAVGRGDERLAGRAAGWLCTHLFRLGRLDEVCAEAPAALARLALPDQREEHCETLRLLAMACCESGRFSEAIDAANRLAVLASDAGDAGWALMGAYALGACFDRIGDPWQAARVLQAAIESHGAAAAPRQRLIACIGMCAFLGDSFHRMRDAVPEDHRSSALAQCRAYGEQAVALLDACSDPLFEMVARGNLGEVLMLQGELTAAWPLLAEAVDLAQRGGLLAHGWRARANVAQWRVFAGRSTVALAEAERLLAEMGSAGPAATVIRVHDIAYQACRALGLAEQALSHFEMFERLDRARTLAQIRHLGEVFVTRVEAQQTERRAERAQREAQLQSRLADEFAHRAEHDSLTGLANRTLLRRKAAELPAGQAGALALIDIDHFKLINDLHGHPAGDAVLVELSQMLRDGLRGADTLARLGGEEFAALLVGADLVTARQVFERMSVEVASRSDWRELPRGRRVTISIGVASTAQGELEQWLRAADAALYAAKRAGRNRVEVADPVS